MRPRSDKTEIRRLRWALREALRAMRRVSPYGPSHAIIFELDHGRREIVRALAPKRRRSTRGDAT